MEKTRKALKPIIIVALLGLLLMAPNGCSKVPISEDNASTSLAQTDSTNAGQAIEQKNEQSEDLIKLQADITAVMDKKLSALKNKNMETYVQTVTANDAYYPNEQKRWFDEMTKEGMKNIQFKVMGVTRRDNDTVVAEIYQTHYYKKNFYIKYPLLFKLENGAWKDCGYDFKITDRPRYELKYMDGEAKVDDFVKMIDNAYANLDQIFPVKQDEHFQIKLFKDQEMLRQRSVPSIEWLFTGWGEPDESLKLYTGHSNTQSYRGTIQHELTHHITIKMCNNNLSSWFLEGLAVYYGNAYYDKADSGSLADFFKDHLEKTINKLERMDLYTTTDKTEVHDWYNTSFAYVAYIVDVYGQQAIIDMLNEAGKKNFNSSVANDNFNAENNQTTKEVIQKVLGISEEKLSKQYVEWLKPTHLFENYEVK